MTIRLRFVGVVLQPQFMADDGDSLVPVPVQPITIAAADWPDVVKLFAVATEQLRAQIEDGSEVPPPAAT